jgi:hypothetical protein
MVSGYIFFSSTKYITRGQKQQIQKGLVRPNNMLYPLTASTWPVFMAKKALVLFYVVSAGRQRNG